jgi:hypothetical protein
MPESAGWVDYPFANGDTMAEIQSRSDPDAEDEEDDDESDE